MLLLQDKLPVIPRKQEDVVGCLRREDFRRDDRYVASGRQKPNFVWGGIGDVFQIIGGKTAEVEQCITFGGGTVCRNHLPFGTKTSHQRDKLVANDFYFFLETAESFQRVETRPFFERLQFLHRTLRGHARCFACKDTNRAAVYIDPLHIKDLHTEALKEVDERLDAVVAQVLVIDRIKFPFLYKVEKIVRFGNKHAVIGKERLYGFDNFVDIVDMREYVVRRNDFRRTVFPGEFLGHINGEKPGNRLDALFACRLGDIRGRLDAEHAACVGQKLQQKAVVATYVDDQVIFLQKISFNIFRIRLEMLHERR